MQNEQLTVSRSPAQTTNKKFPATKGKQKNDRLVLVNKTVVHHTESQAKFTGNAKEETDTFICKVNTISEILCWGQKRLIKHFENATNFVQSELLQTLKLNKKNYADGRANKLGCG